MSGARRASQAASAAPPAACADAGSDAWADALLAARLLAGDAGLGGAVVRAPAGPVRDAWLAAYRAAAAGPIVRLPLHVDDDRLLGGIDLAATLAAGRPVATRGLLAEAAGGTLVVPSAERVSAALAGRLAAAMDAGLRVVLLDEGEGDEGAPSVLAERCGLWVGLPATRSGVSRDLDNVDDFLPPSPPVSEANGERGGTWGNAASPEAALSRSTSPTPALPALRRSASGGEGEEGALRIASDEDDAVATLCATALAFGVGSARAGVFALRAARALAVEGAGVDDAVTAAARLVLGPRATRLPAVHAEDDAPSSDADAPPPSGDPTDGASDGDARPHADSVVA
ncbi:MAG: hypothetical protein JO290_09365, partial [Sphingomonadaceae bacterium]|nr:hypothetical protein [Sphingomonadaceae bacterium]